MATIGELIINPVTHERSYPVTVHINQETIMDLYGAYTLDLRGELIQIFGEEVLAAIDGMFQKEIEATVAQMVEMYPIDASMCDEPLSPELLQIVERTLGVSIEPTKNNG